MFDITLEEVKAKLTEQRAIDYMKGYEPNIENLELFPEMLDSILAAPSQEQFENFTLIYILDMKYPRGDIAFATSVVKREKGWRT